MEGMRSRASSRLRLAMGVLAVSVAASAALGPPASAGAGDVHVRRVSLDWRGDEISATSVDPALSGDGRFVAFHSYGSSVSGVNVNKRPQVYRRNLSTGSVQLVSQGFGGAAPSAVSDEGIALSGTGRFVAFGSKAANLTLDDDDNGVTDVFVRDMSEGSTELISWGDGESGSNESRLPSISDDGRFVAFYSWARDLVPAGATAAVPQIYVFDRALGEMRMVSVSSGGAIGNQGSYVPRISGNGRYLAYYSEATNLSGVDGNRRSDVYRTDLVTGTTALVSRRESGPVGNGYSSEVSISDDGQRLAFMSGSRNLVAHDTNGRRDVFLADFEGPWMRRVSVSDSEAQGVGSEVLLNFAEITGDGSAVAFVSGFSNLVRADRNGQEDLFVRRVNSGRTLRVSVRATGAEATQDAGWPAVARTPGVVAWVTWETLRTGDNNGEGDVYLRKFP